MQTVATRAEPQQRPWIRHRGSAAAQAACGGSDEPLWARRTKWALLVLAVALTVWTLFELTRTLLVLAEAPITVVTALPPLPPPGEPRDGAERAARPETEAVAADAVEPLAPPESATPGVAAGGRLHAEELRKLRKLLEARPRPVEQTSPSPAPARPLLPGIQRAEPPRRATARTPRPENALRIVSGPRVRLVGADALVDALVENRLASRFERTVALELMVDGKQRQRRKLRLRIPPGARLHLSERFSTTLPDGTYSARLTVPPFG